MMKTVLRVLAAAALCLLLGGCTLFTPVRELLAAPAYSARNEALRRAFESAFGRQTQYCAPISGAYLSSFVVEDLDGDGDEEALVFFRPDTFTTTVRIGVLDFADGEWQRTAELEGGGSDVYSVELADLDNDGVREVVLCWSTADNTRVMSVYACTDTPFSLRRLTETAYTAKLLADLDGDGQTEIFTLLLSSEGGVQTAHAYAARKKDLRIFTLDRIELDSRVSGYAGIYMHRAEPGCVLYADAYKGDDQMITEVICFDAETSSLSAPLFDPQTRTNERTWRSIPIRCRDLDGDGAPEIPCQSKMLPGAEARRDGTLSEYPIYLTNWCAFRDGELVAVQDSLVHDDLRWQFRIPDSMQGRFTLRAERDIDAWSFVRFDPVTQSCGEQIFRAVFTTRTRWEENRESVFAPYTLLCEENGDVLLAYGMTESDEQLRDAFEYIGG